MFIIKSRYYADSDQFGESYIITSDNGSPDKKFEKGEKVDIIKEMKCRHCEGALDPTEDLLCNNCYNTNQS
jgi:hypothetical protein